MGSPDGNMEAFMGPVIHKPSFDKITSIIDASNKDSGIKLLAGGEYDGSVGYYVKPTVYQVSSPNHKLMNEEIFGPVLAIYVYKDADWNSILESVDKNGGGLALTGAVFAQDRAAIRQAEDTLRYSAGNFYISKSATKAALIYVVSNVFSDSKTTAALIGQQSFGGARSSGTNDKAGSSDVLRRFTSPRTIKEEFGPLKKFTYPSNE